MVVRGCRARFLQCECNVSAQRMSTAPEQTHPLIQYVDTDTPSTASRLTKGILASICMFPAFRYHRGGLGYRCGRLLIARPASHRDL